MSVDLANLRSHITAKDGHEYDALADSLVILNVTHSNLTRRLAEIRLDKHLTIAAVKEKIATHCGTSPQHMTLLLCLADTTVVANLNDDAKMLGFYPVDHFMTLHVVDTDPYSLALGGAFDDVSLVKKYEISEADYDAREKTVRRYKKDQLAKDPNWKPKVLPGASAANRRSRPATTTPPATIADIAHLNLKDRVSVMPGGRLGAIAFLGEITTLNDGGYWVGVLFDEPVGKCAGSVHGTTYFNCDDKFGGFVRPSNVTAGDFPPVDEFASDDDEL